MSLITWKMLQSHVASQDSHHHANYPCPDNVQECRMPDNCSLLEIIIHQIQLF